MPEWLRRRRAEREAEEAARWQRRVTALIGDLLPVEALWSNASLKAYCLDCRSFAPAPAFTLGLDPSTPCAHCGEAVGAAR